MQTAMQTVAASLLLVHIMLVCPTLPTPVSTMTRDSPKLESVSLAQRIQTELRANKERVLKILEGREWYRAFLELLRNELKKKADHRIEVANIYMGMSDAPRIRRSVEQEFAETLGPLLSRAARSVEANEDSQVEVSAALKVDGKVCLNVTKKAEAIRLGDSNEIIKADIGNTEILLSMKVTKKGAASGDEAMAQPPHSLPLHRASNDAVVRGPSSVVDTGAAVPDLRLSAAARTPPPQPPPAPPTPKPTVRATSTTGAAAEPPPPPPRSPIDADFDSVAAAAATAQAVAAAAAAAADAESPRGNASRSGAEQPWLGDYSQLQTHCSDRNYCLFGGTCVYYGIIELPLCNCRKGYTGNRCELYDINEVLSTLDSAHKRRVIGNGPIVQQGDHMDVLSVVESTAIYLLHIPKNYPSPQAMQLIQNILLSN